MEEILKKSNLYINYDIRYDAHQCERRGITCIMVYELFQRMQIHGERRAAR